MRSKKQKDASAIEEIRTTMVTNLADPTYSDLEATIVYDAQTLEITKGGVTVSGSSTAADVSSFLTAVSGDVKDWKFTSKAYKAKDKVTFVIKDQMVTAYREAEGESVAAGGSGATTTVAP